MQYERLVEFKRNKGHCQVPRRYELDKSLGLWVNAQRVYHKYNKLRQDRKRILDAIGFAWKYDGGHHYDDKLWQKQCEKLVEFKRNKGHCMVTQRYEVDKSLGPWVNKQRSYYNNNKLRFDRKRLLDEIGFAWNCESRHNFNQQDKLWHQQYEKLVECKRKRGHCMVPCVYEQDKPLGTWVSNQRRTHNNGKMRPDRKELLDEIGFAWKADVLAARASTTDVRVLVISSFHPLQRSCCSLSLFFCLTSLHRSRNRKR
jgi:hypothetical protein